MILLEFYFYEGYLVPSGNRLSLNMEGRVFRDLLTREKKIITYNIFCLFTT